MKQILSILITLLMSATIVLADEWADGYNLGYQLGRVAGEEGARVPRDVELRDLAHKVAAGSNNIIDKEHFESGFRGGFEVGYKEATKKAF
jgi:hypothetical protein